MSSVAKQPSLTDHKDSSKFVDETPMMRQFLEIKQEHADKILFFRMGDFYEMFGEDAVQAARVLQIALTSRNKREANPVPMCGVPYHAYEQYLNKLTSAGYKVAICEQVEDPKLAKGIVQREVVRVVTPGTTVSPQLMAPDRNNYLVALVNDLKRKRCGIAYVDVSTGEFETAEFHHAEMIRLYDFIYQIQPQEILIAESRSEAESRMVESLAEQLDKVLRRLPENPNLLTFISPYYFEAEAAKQQLLQHFKVHNLSGFGIDELEHGTRACGALLRYLLETQKCDLAHINRIRRHVFEHSMLLDETTISNLELFEGSGGQHRNTLYAVLNKTRTAMGARLLRGWLRQPLTQAALINERYDAIETLQGNFILCEEMRNLFSRIQDLPRIIARISMPVVGINDMVGLRESLQPLQELPRFFEPFPCKAFERIAEKYDPLEDLSETLFKYLLEAPASKLREGNYINDGLDEELDELRQITRNTKQVLNSMVESEKERTGIGSLKISYNKVFGYYIEISNTHRDAVPETYIRKQTLVNAERYITAELKELEEKILGAEERIKEIEYDRFQELKALVLTNVARIQQTAACIAEIDVLSTLAEVAENHNYVRPRIHDLNAPRRLRLKDSRHPVIEQLAFEEPFVANDVDLHDAGQQIMLITGPNMAGKSTYMRQVALNVLMAQCGCFIPAAQAEISLVDRIFTRVGASDNLSRGQSTFMVEMNEAAAILNNATDRSLIILDEIGRGTSTFDGISIAWAIIEHIHRLGALTLCATHYHELTAISQELKNVKNYNILVKEEADDIVFIRKIGAGEADRSYGVHVAKLAGLPNEVVERAMQVMKELEANSVMNHLPRFSQPNPTNDSDESGFEIRETETPYQTSTASQQLSFFEEDSPHLEEIRRLKLDRMSPIKALNYLYDLQSKL